MEMIREFGPMEWSIHLAQAAQIFIGLMSIQIRVIFQDYRRGIFI
jgi:hypothetical protein